MFDSLKDKLGSFRKEVEETAEEKAEEVEPVDEESAEETEREATGETAAETEAVAATEESGTVEDASAAESAAVESETGPVDDEPTASAVEAETAASEAADADETAAGETPTGETEADADEAETEEATGSNGSTGFVRKAKSFATGRIVIEEEDLEDPLWELQMALLESDVEMSVAEEILDGIREELVGETRKFTESASGVVEDALREVLLSVISVGQFDFDERIAEADKPLVIIFTGVNGVGKTTSIAKLSKYLRDRGYSTVMANGDTYRAGANEQIREHAENLGVKLITHEQGGDPAAVIYDGVEYAKAHDVDVVLGDTAGRLHTSEGLMDQLAKIGRVVDPDVTLFVDESVAGQDAVNRAREFDEAAEVDGSILTKADADSNGGAAISIAHVTGKPILFLGTGQGYDDIERFDPETMVDRLLGADE